MKFIKHKNMKDVCFQVYETQRELFNRWETVKGQWWNIALGDPFPIVPETIVIKDPENWENYDIERLNNV